nr:hypothetical protein [Tanacetum cinerariifolium]
MKDVVLSLSMDGVDGVESGALFIEEIVSSGVHPVPAKLAELLKEIQTKDRETVVKLQMLEREMELNAITEQADSIRLQDEIKLWFNQACTEDQSFVRLICDLCFELMITMHKNQRWIAVLGALGDPGDAVTSLNHMRDIVAHEYAKLAILEQLLAGTDVMIRLNDGYVANMEYKEQCNTPKLGR